MVACHALVAVSGWARRASALSCDARTPLRRYSVCLFRSAEVASESRAEHARFPDSSERSLGPVVLRMLSAAMKSELHSRPSAHLT